jgi:hypothetical protein
VSFPGTTVSLQPGFLLTRKAAYGYLTCLWTRESCLPVMSELSDHGSVLPAVRLHVRAAFPGAGIRPAPYAEAGEPGNDWPQTALALTSERARDGPRGTDPGTAAL